MADPIPPSSGPPWSNLVYLFIIAAFGWFGDFLRSRYQNRKPPTLEHEHRRHDDPPCEECHHHHREDDEE